MVGPAERKVDMAKTKKMKVSVSSYDILFPDSHIFVESAQSLDPESAQSGITVRGQRGQIRLSRGNKRASWSSGSFLPPGQHTLSVGEFVTKAGKKIVESMEIPFFVTDSKARVPANFCVESMLRLMASKTWATRSRLQTLTMCIR